MKIINRIVEAEMTADEQVELMRLEDEVAQARDEVDQLFDGEDVLFRCERNLNNYIDSITKKVMERLNLCEHMKDSFCDVCMANHEPDTRSEEDAYWDNQEEEWYRVKQGL